jgi:hypothetical protein
VREIVLVSHSKIAALTPQVLTKIAAALTRQLMGDYANVHQSQGVPVRVAASGETFGSDTVLAAVFDAAPDAGYLGYHDLSPQGIPYEKIFLSPILASGGTLFQGDDSLSVTLSHECLELIEDPYCNAWHDMPDGRTEDARELADRVEGDSYPIDGVSVSNFLGPRAFRDGLGPFDFLGMQGDHRGLVSPFQIRPNGYAIRRVGGPSGKTSSVFGASYPEHRREAKIAAGSRFARRSASSPAMDLDITIDLTDSAP